MLNQDAMSENPALDSKKINEFFRGAYVLTVDDFSVNRRILINTLRPIDAFVDEADNGLIALDKIRMAYENNAPYDVVFMDIEMPVMDGVQFLRTLRSDPQLRDTLVIMLTSHSEKEEIRACASLGVTDYILKPVNKERIYHAVAKALAGRDSLTGHGLAAAGKAEAPEAEGSKNYGRTIFQKLESIESMPTLPVVLERIKQLTTDPNANNEMIARIMEDEPSMMANVLKLANSALYGARERIDTLQAAITRMGLNAVYNLASTMAVLSVMNQAKKDGFDHKEYCRHSICVGMAMAVLYNRSRERLKKVFADDYLHLSGLLHDIGKIIIVCFFPDEFERSLSMSGRHSMSLYECEHRVMGVDHAQVGAWLGKKWALSESQIETIGHHHSPFIKETEDELVILCHIANFICNFEGLGNGGDAMAPQFDRRAFARLGLSLDQIPSIVEDVRKEARKSEVLMSFLR